MKPPNYAKKFSEQFSRWQPDALAYRGNQALATVHFVVRCFHLEGCVGDYAPVEVVLTNTRSRMRAFTYRR